MDRRRRGSSTASKSLPSRQLASITDTLAKASQRRDEEAKRARRPSRTSTATTNSASPKKLTASVQRAVSDHGQQTPVTMYLRGGGDEGNSDPYHTPCVEQWEKAEGVRQERKEFENMVKGKGPDDPEREQMVECLLARSNPAKMSTQKEVLREGLEAEEEKVGEDEQIVIREREIDDFKELMLEEEEDMELEDCESRLRQLEEEMREGLRARAKDWAQSIRSEFPTQTNHAALFNNSEEEKAGLACLEEELFEHLVAPMEARDAKDLEAATASRGSEEVDEGNKKSKPAESPGDSAMALLSDEHKDEHALPAIPQLRSAEEDDQDAEHHETPLATTKKAEEAQREAAALAAAAAAKEEEEEQQEEERNRKIRDDYKKMTKRVALWDIVREATVIRAEGRMAREKAGRTSGLAGDKAFECIRASEEARDCERIEAAQWLRRQVFPNDTENADEAVTNKSAEEELRRLRRRPEAERSYLLPPASPPDSPPPSYAASEKEVADGNTIDAVMRGGIRGGHATPLDDDPGALLAELASLRETVHLPEAEIEHTVHGSDVLRQMLAEFDRPARSTQATVDISNDPRVMLEELLALSAPGPRELRSPTSEDFEEEGDDDISALRARLERLTLPARSVTPTPAPVGLDEGRVETAIADGLPPEAIPYVVALELELSDCEWAVAQGWTRCLFSSSLDSYEAQKEKETAVTHAEEALQKTIDSVMKVEQDNHRKDEETKLQRRLIVSNLAASSEAEEVERQFWQYRYDIVNITMLPDRDPLKRTQTAHVDFSGRKTAVQASFTSGQVYGLIFDVKLAVPVE